MTFHRSWAVPLVALGVLAAVAMPGTAAPAPNKGPAPLSEEQYADGARELDELLSQAFKLPAALPLDADLRTQADAIAAAHLARIRPLLPGWLREERRLQAAAGEDASQGSVFKAVWARLLNELALWQIEPGDAAYEKATLAVLENAPDACLLDGDVRSVAYVGRIMRVQAMPPAQRPAVLAQERELLDHWGKPRAAVALWPDPLPQDAGRAAIARLRVEGARPPLALPPVLASVFLAEGGAYDKQPLETKCRFQQWWLRVGLAQGAAPAAVLNAFRYGTLVTATLLYGQNAGTEVVGAPDKSGAQAGMPAYPKFAAQYDVTGTTKIRRRVDAAGKPVEASVIGRTIKVRGIRGVRPVAFEDTFDALSIALGMQPGVKTTPIDERTGVFQTVWQLEPDAAASTPDNGRQGGRP